MVEIGEQLKYFRQRKGMSQKQIAEFLHVTPQTISKW
ncbi:helix-turn-helix domain-containing protein [Enterococcus hulanensis]|nr:helix-turn-helix transcriptional regulator [Enterococcus hulanensis]